MNSDNHKEAETARTSTNSQPSLIPIPTARLMQPPPPDAPLSEGVRCFLLRQEQEGAAELTLAEYRGAAWSLFEFLGLDPPLRELNKETAARWLDWLRTTPAYHRKRGAYPQALHAAGGLGLLQLAAGQERRREDAGGRDGRQVLPARLPDPTLAERARGDRAPQAEEVPPAAADRAEVRRHRRPLEGRPRLDGRADCPTPPDRADASPVAIVGHKPGRRR